MRRRTYLAGMASMAALGLGSGQAKAAPVTLKMWTFLPITGNDPRTIALRGIVDSFNAGSSGYKVEVQSINYGQIDNMVIQATAAGQGPDILNVYTDLLPLHVSAHTIQPLDARVATMPAAERNDFVVPLKFMNYGGHVMALPWECRVWLLWYRSDLLRKADLAVPGTLEEMAVAAGKLSAGNVMGFVMGASSSELGAGAIETFTPLLWDAGGDLLDAHGKAIFNSAAGERVLSYLRDLVKKYHGMGANVVTMNADDALSSIKAGTAAMTIGGSYRVSAARDSAITRDTLLTAPIPGFVSGAPTPARLASQTLTIGANTKYADGAWAFIMHHLSPASQLAFAKAAEMPSRISAYKDAYFTTTAQGKEMSAWADYAHKYGRLEPMPSDFPKLAAGVAEAIQKVILGTADPKAALDAAAAAYNAHT